jgi:hypothetical protein
MNSPDRVREKQRYLLILACSQRKRPDPGLLPAIERYDGPTFRVLRRFLREQPNKAKQIDIFILSAAYGLISANYPIKSYNIVMATQRTSKLRDEVMRNFIDLLSTGGYSELCLAMSKKYLQVLKNWSEKVSEGISVKVLNGAQGVRLSELKHWLWKINSKDRKQKSPNIVQYGIARLRGVELSLTPIQVLEKAQIELGKNESGADCFREWYVEIENRQISPKWLVSKLTGLPVSDFTSGEARRFLNRLGIQTLQIIKERK